MFKNFLLIGVGMVAIRWYSVLTPDGEKMQYIFDINDKWDHPINYDGSFDETKLK